MLCFRCGSRNPDGSKLCLQCGQRFVDDMQKPKPRDPAKPSTAHPADEDRHALAIGSRAADRYAIRSVIGKGPLGTVYRAHDVEIEVDVALKALSPELFQTQKERRHFSATLRKVRTIKHPGMIRIYDEDLDGERVYYTMQLLEGLSLRKIIQLRKEKGQAFALGEIVPIFSHICQALEEAHKVCAHGNLKPENVIVLPDVLKVTDFGLAGGIAHRAFLAAQHKAAGGFAYLAPETRETGETPKLPSDIYALGVILGEMLSGEIYAGSSPGLLHLPNDAEALSGAIERALSEDPARRQNTPRELFEEIYAQAKPGSRASKPSRPVAKRDAAQAEADPAEEEVVGSLEAEPEADGDSLVAPRPTPWLKADSDLRVARPKDASAAPSDRDDAFGRLEDRVQLLSNKKRRDTQPPRSAASLPPQAPAGILPTSGQPPASQPVMPPMAQPSYPPGNYSQPPYPYSQPPYAVSQPPPPPSRWPIYLFLVVIALLATIVVIFVVDYIIAAKEQLTQRQVIASTPPEPDPPIEQTAASAPGVEKAARQAKKRRKVEPAKKTEPHPKAEPARESAGPSKTDQAPKTEQRRKAEQPPKAVEPGLDAGRPDAAASQRLPGATPIPEKPIPEQSTPP